MKVFHIYIELCFLCVMLDQTLSFPRYPVSFDFEQPGRGVVSAAKLQNSLVRWKLNKFYKFTSPVVYRSECHLKLSKDAGLLVNSSHFSFCTVDSRRMVRAQKRQRYGGMDTKSTATPKQWNCGAIQLFPMGKKCYEDYFITFLPFWM